MSTVILRREPPGLRFMAVSCHSDADEVLAAVSGKQGKLIGDQAAVRGSVFTGCRAHGAHQRTPGARAPSSWRQLPGQRRANDGTGTRLCSSIGRCTVAADPLACSAAPGQPQLTRHTEEQTCSWQQTVWHSPWDHSTAAS
jgi:hypothetical protein